jgi:DNA repair protein RecN (Recombination protein N)
MLSSLRIRDYALIDDLALDFEPGLSVLTGETGAGKSIIVGALSLLLGDKPDTTSIRTGADSATVEGRFRDCPAALAAAAALGITPATGDADLLLRRRVDRTGRSAAWACDGPVTIAGLARTADRLIDLHGQHEHQLLLRPDFQLETLDAYAGLAAERRAFGERYERRAALAVELARRDEQLGQARARRELTEFQLNELAAAHVTAGEIEELHRERELLQSAERRYALARQLEELLSDGEPSAGSLLAAAVKALAVLAELDPAQSEGLDALRSAQAAADDTWRRLVRYREGVEFSPERLEEVNARLFLIEKLERKYRVPAAELPALEAGLRAEADGLEHHHERRTALASELLALDDQLAAAATALTKKRTRAARRLEPLLKAELDALGLGRAELALQLTQSEGLTPSGRDTAEFLFSANPGEEPRPLRKVASGGELSRLMLALKGVLAEADPVPTLVFDEVDSGIGGRIAEAVGRRLARLARARQVIVITHLPQIARHADTHYAVTKRSRDGRVVTSARRLDDAGRTDELARMLAGATVTPATIAHARELLRDTSESTARRRGAASRP